MVIEGFGVLRVLGRLLRYTFIRMRWSEESEIVSKQAANYDLRMESREQSDAVAGCRNSFRSICSRLEERMGKDLLEM